MKQHTASSGRLRQSHWQQPARQLRLWQPQTYSRRTAMSVHTYEQLPCWGSVTTDTCSAIHSLHFIRSRWLSACKLGRSREHTWGRLLGDARVLSADMCLPDAAASGHAVGVPAVSLRCSMHKQHHHSMHVQTAKGQFIRIRGLAACLLYCCLSC